MIWTSLMSIVILILAWQDLKFREVNLWLLIFLFVIVILSKIVPGKVSATTWLLSTLFNFSFLLVQYCLLIIFYFLKSGKIKNILDRYLGVGDVIFFIVMAIALPPEFYLFGYIGSLVFTLVLALFLRGKDNAWDTIPLIFGAGMFFIVYMYLIYAFPFAPFLRFY